MFKKLIGFFILFSFFLMNVSISSASSFNEFDEYSLLNNSNDIPEKSTDEERAKVPALDVFLNSELLVIGSADNDKAKNYIYSFGLILNISISSPNPPPNFLAPS